MPQYRYKARITDEIVDAMEIIRNTGRMLQNQKIDANTVVQNFVEETDNYVKSVIHNPDNGWRVYVTYKYIDNNNLSVTYEGDYNGSRKFTRKEIK